MPYADRFILAVVSLTFASALMMLAEPLKDQLFIHQFAAAITGQTAAAWVQAVGAIIAIYAAARIASAQQRKADADQRAAAAAVLEVRAELVWRLADNAFGLLSPITGPAEVDIADEDWPAYIARWKRKKAPVIELIKGLTKALDAISPSDCKSVRELKAMMHCQEHARDLVNALKEFETESWKKRRFEWRGLDLFSGSQALAGLAEEIRGGEGAVLKNRGVPFTDSSNQKAFEAHVGEAQKHWKYRGLKPLQAHEIS